jgi:YfiH family protein
MFTLVRNEGVQLIKSRLLQDLEISHCITTRHGGVSLAPYDSLNMAFHTGDDPAHVCENRRRVCHALGYRLDQLVVGEQVHGCNVHIVTHDDAGRGACNRESAIQDTDILLTNTPGTLLASFYADCIPLLLVDPIKRVVGLAHCGWRGTQLEAPRVALEAMATSFGTYVKDVRAVIGPGIGPCCYEVSTQMAIEFQRQFGPHIALGRFLDLRLANQVTLERIGVPATQVHTAPFCTSCQQDLFYSHRAHGGHTGRIATLIGL